MNELTVILPTNQIRIETRLRNNILWKIIMSNYPNVNQFCIVNSLYPSTVGELLNLKCDVFNKNGSYRKIVTDISAIFKLLPEDIFPENLYKLEKTSAVAEIPISQLTVYQNQCLQLPSPEDTYIQKEAKEAILNAIDTLSQREAGVIRGRYGIDCERKTLEELATEYNITKERVRQIACKGIRKLQHPSRSEKLEYILDSF